MNSKSSQGTFTDRLISVIERKKSHVVVGLDPRLEGIPSHLQRGITQKFGFTAQAMSEVIFEFNQRIIDAVHEHAVAVKPQIAFYEKFGYLGIKAFEQTVSYAKQKGLIVIADVKRNDIGSTVEAYSDGYLGRAEFWNNEQRPVFDVDSMTVNAYLGWDGIQPFIRDVKKYGKGIFVLVKTSNQSSVELQDIETDKGKIYEIAARLVDKWGEGTEGRMGYKSVGAVVGATYPAEATLLRRIMPKSFFLVPGYGAQGATAREVVSCFNPDGYGAIINSARDIIFAYQKTPWRDQFPQEEFAEAAQAATIRMKEEINAALEESGLLAW